MLTLRHVHPPPLVAVPTPVGQKCLQHVVVIPHERQIQGRRPAPLQEPVRPRLDIIPRHPEPPALVALVGRVAFDRTRRGPEVFLQQPRMPQRAAERLAHDAGVRLQQLSVPLRGSPALDHGDRHPLVQVVLPPGKVQDDVESRPPEQTDETGADQVRIRRLHMLIRLRERVFQLDPVHALQRRIRAGIHILQEHGGMEALSQASVAQLAYAVRDPGLFQVDEIPICPTHAAQADNGAGPAVAEDLEHELIWQVQYVRDMRLDFSLFDSALLSLLGALSALGAQREALRQVH